MGSFEGIDLSVARIQESLLNNLATEKTVASRENAADVSVDPIVALETEKSPLTQIDKALGTHLDTLG